MGAVDLDLPTMIGATGRQSEGRLSAFFPSGVCSQVWAKPIQQLPRPDAQAANIKFWAASAQSSIIHGPAVRADIRTSTGAW
jgi:hypothetical protein